MRPFLRWWVVFCLAILGLVFLSMNGVATILWEVDLSKLSLIIIALWAIAAVWIGVLTKQATHGDVPAYKLKPLWWLADAMQALGLIGTLLGIYWVFSGAFGALDPSQVEAIKAAIGTIGGGLATALLTTLVGISASQVTKLQLVNLEYLIDGKQG